MKKLTAISAILAVSLFSAEVKFDMAPRGAEHIMPNSLNQVFSFNKAVERARKAVVNISTKKHVRFNNTLNYLFNDPFFKDFFGRHFDFNIPKERIQRSLGSGVIISKDGYIVTNNHVINDADEITVTLQGSDKEYPAKIIGKDPDSDLAVIKIDAPNLTPITLGYADELKVGDVVFAIGNPFGVGETVTQGIISALNKNRVGINRYENFIQTDASINPGNSGGALVDSRGALIGINSAIISRSGGNNGVGFAIPVDMVKDVATKLIKYGKIQRGYMGVSIKDLDENLKSVYKHDYGAVVLDVVKGSAAEKAGIKRGDLIFEVDGKKVKNAAELQRVIANYPPNKEIKVKIERDKKEKSLKLVLGSRSSEISLEAGKAVLGGIYLNELDKQNRYRYRIPPSVHGVLVTDVEPNSSAEKAGIQAGDVIVQIEDIEVKSMSDIEKAIRKYGHAPKKVFVNRYGNILIFVLK